ncbi:MAG: methyltransferase, partial [Hyphomonas sp.]
LIAEPMAGIRGAEAMADAYFGLYLWAMGRGRPRRAEELAALLEEAGFNQIRHLRTAQPLLVSAIIAS